jgi:branched-chain amino acid transport system ATP-binding protein
MTGALEVEDLVVRYGRVEALHGISLRVGGGETVALIGRNGAGKTTLLQTIYGFVRPAAGAIRYDGTDITRVPPYGMARRGIAYVPETRGVFHELSILENLRLGALRARDREDERMEEVFDLFPVLRSRRGERAGTLSGGQQQMLALGRALMGGPGLLLLDEPSLGLAPTVADGLFESLRRLAVRGMAILLVEQNVRRALAIAARGYLLNLGAVAMAASATEMSRDERLERVYLGRGGEALGGETA